MDIQTRANVGNVGLTNRSQTKPMPLPPTSAPGQAAVRLVDLTKKFYVDEPAFSADDQRHVAKDYALTISAIIAALDE